MIKRSQAKRFASTHSLEYRPNLGFEQSFASPRLGLRCGLDETSLTAGFSLKVAPFDLAVAYVNNMAQARVGDVFGLNSRSLVVTFTLDYRALTHAR